MIAGGSDAPVERGEPMIEFYAAVARKSIKGESGEGWHPEEKVTREQALKMLTIWPAYAAFEEKEKGTIEAGKLADFTVLSADIMKIPEPEILQTKCLDDNRRRRGRVRRIDRGAGEPERALADLPPGQFSVQPLSQATLAAHLD